MKIYETKSQFILAEEGIEISEGVKTYDIEFINHISMLSQEFFPQYELFFETYGVFRYKCGLSINYRGIEIRTTSDENLESLILNLLNRLKKGNYEKEMISFLKERLSEEKTDAIKTIFYYKNPKITSLEREVKTLKNNVEELSSLSLQSENEKLKTENERLNQKIAAFKEILS